MTGMYFHIETAPVLPGIQNHAYNAKCCQEPPLYQLVPEPIKKKEGKQITPEKKKSDSTLSRTDQPSLPRLQAYSSSPVWNRRSAGRHTNSYLFIFWEKTTAPVGQTQITATIRDTSGNILAAGYSGQMSSNWTCHTMNVAAFAGQTIRIYFSTNKSTSSGALYFDDISVTASYVNINAIRLSV